MQVKWGLRLFIKDLIIVIIAFLVAYHFYVTLVTQPYIQAVFYG